MKQRILTSLFITAILLFAFLAREFSLFVFDALVLTIAVFSAYEFSKLLSKCGLYNYKVITLIYPFLSYGLLVFSLLNNHAFYIAFVIQASLILILLIQTSHFYFF